MTRRLPSRISRALALLAASTLALPAVAAPNCTRDAMVVFDGSGSMAEMGFNLLDEPRIFSARRAIERSMPALAEMRRLGLIIYGPGPDAACSNIDLRFGPRVNAAQPIIDAVDGLDPAGETPLTDAVRLAAETLEYRSRPGIVVLVTDGKETCGGTPCQLAAELRADAADLTVHVIGFKVQSDHFKYPNAPVEEQESGVAVAQCMADLTGGKYVSTETVDELADALRETLGCNLIGQVGISTRRRG